MTRFENFGRFQVFRESLMFHAWKKSPLLCRVVTRWGKMFSIMHSRVTRMWSGSCFKVSLWHWELQEVSSWRHRGSSACFWPWFSFARNWYDRFLVTTLSKARRHSVFTRNFSQFSVLNWKHFSLCTQWRFLSRMEHQTFDENLKSTEVFNSCHI
jgi:hypothetical protein